MTMTMTMTVTTMMLVVTTMFLGMPLMMVVMPFPLSRHHCYLPTPMASAKTVSSLALLA